jgi:DNA-binding NarL/FixJ family response regulator
MDNKTKVILVEDDQLIRESFASLLNESGELECVKAFGSCEEMLKEVAELEPDVVLMDIELPGMSGIEGIKKIKKILPSTDIIAVTVHEDPSYVFDALCAGASGYLTKNITPRQLINAIAEAVKGGAPMSTSIARMVINSFHKSSTSPLSPRETEVLQLLAKGKSYTMIAGQLFIDKETVRSHIKNIYIKLEVNSKAAALDKATREKFI